MPIISQVEAKSTRIRILYGLIYLVLSLGAVTMVYPMLIMISGSFKSDADLIDMDPFPKFIYNDEIFFRKYLEGKYNGVPQQLRWTWNAPYRTWRTIPLPRGYENEKLLAMFRDFKDEYLPSQLSPIEQLQWQMPGHVTSNRLLEENWRGYRDKLEAIYGDPGYISNSKYCSDPSRKFSGDALTELNKEMNTSLTSWMTLLVPSGEKIYRRYWPVDSAMERIAQEYFLQDNTQADLYFVNVDGNFVHGYIIPLYGESPDNDYGDPCNPSYNAEDPDRKNYNQLHGTDYDSFDELMLTRRVPAAGKSRDDWAAYVLGTLNLTFIRIDASQQPAYQTFLRKKYLDDIHLLNDEYKTDYGTFDEIPMPTSAPQDALVRAGWNVFIQNAGRQDLAESDGGNDVGPTLESIEVYGPRQMFEDYLTAKGFDYSGISGSVLAVASRDYDWWDFQTRHNHFFWEYIKRNYVYVVDYLVTHGRGVWNTFVYCSLMILANLIINPMAAYAMSRYKLPSTYKILLFCMATMAFPPAVTMIPSFLLLRDMGLINTYAALILPVMANGYWIFLLKGFFDSLPQELYEAANLDGASEWRMFWMITMSLSKPVLAVIALQAFTMSYGAFMYALIVIPDQRMWTLMVWIYQLQQNSHQGAVYASLILAAIPPFTIFLLAQNVIMRGIVVPVEK